MYRSYLRTYRERFAGVGFVLFLLLNGLQLFAQPGTTIEIPKPQKYESRTLASEKSGEKKFTTPKRIYNNTVSRFNYYFNANAKLNEILEKAKAVSPDDYTQLLPFYKYSLDVTAKDHLDSVIYKTTAGILLHDLRSDWVDKLYLLMGRAYMFHKDFDSATMVFQYINYAFAPKDDGYDIPIGSNASNTNGVFTVATRENRGFWKRIMSFPPSRNEGLVWQARNYIEQERYVEAASLLEILRADPNFPARLQSFLHETTAYVLYKQQAWGAAAAELTKAIEKPDEKREVPRMEYLAAQLYQRAGNEEAASLFFERAIKHTNDPLMEIYARLSLVGLSSAAEQNALQRNLDELLKMARRDRYEGTRDIIYFAAANLELRRKNYEAAQALLLKSIFYNNNNLAQRQQSFLVLGDLNYARKAYGLSYAYYDSIQLPLLKEPDQARVKERKPALQIISQNVITVNKQDSLEKLALMGVEERNLAVRKVLRQLRKEKGLKDLGNGDPNYGNGFAPASASNLFANPGAGGGSEFYFLNSGLRARGVTEFKTKWGNRPNVDNWRRQSAVDRTLNTATALKEIKAGVAAAGKDDDLSFESLYKNIPLTPVQKDSANALVIRALLGNALTFQNRLEDYPSAIEVYEELLKRFPESGEVEQILFNLAYCYRKVNDPAKADAAAARLKQSFGKGKYAAQLDMAAKKTDPAEKQYADIYKMFIEGRFAEAKEAKLKADKQFGKIYWTPQLLYIESIYYIKQHEDSTAINRLQNIATLFNQTPLAEKARTMIDVLKRRKEIENYLANLKVERNDDFTRGVDLDSINPFTGLKVRRPAIGTPPEELSADKKDLPNIWDRSTVGTDIVRPRLDSGLITAKAPAHGLNLGMEVKNETVKKDGYSFNLTDTQYVAVILEKVDPIFVTEGRNAFNRFNQERFPSERIAQTTQKLDDANQLLLFGPFANTLEALGYIDKTRPLTATRIVPWLTAEKYSFVILSRENMKVLLETKNLAGYRAFLHELFPDKF